MCLIWCPSLKRPGDIRTQREEVDIRDQTQREETLKHDLVTEESQQFLSETLVLALLLRGEL